MGNLENERIRACETEIERLKEARNDMEHRMRNVEMTIWKAVGVGTAFNTLLLVALALYKH